MQQIGDDKRLGGMENETAFAEFVRDRAAALYGYGYVLTGNSHDADDLVQ